MQIACKSEMLTGLMFSVKDSASDSPYAIEGLGT